MRKIIASFARLTAGTFFILGLAFTVQAQSLPSDLAPIAASQIPRSVCTYYSIQKFSLWPPLPFNWLSDSNVVLYVSPSLGTNAIFVGDLAVDYAQQAAEAQVLGLAAGAANGQSPDDDPNSGPAGFNYTTNDLYLELVSLTNDSSGASATLLIHAPQPSVFDLFFAPSLPPANSQGWYWVARALPGETNLTVPNLPTDAGFFILGTTNGGIDPTTGLTAACMALVGPSALTNDFNGNGIPDIWEVTYLGGLYPGTNDYDGTGFTILYDWLNGIDPNMIQFSLSVTDPYVNSSQVAIGLNVSGGVPASMAVLVNSTNFDSAAWQSYSPNPAVTLGTNDGGYDVWIGLRGRLGNSRQTWQGTTLTRDTVPPALAISSPATSVTARPTIQLQGCSDKPLAAVSFDLTNAAGLLANQPGFVTGQYADTNTFKLTTNWFQGYDLALAPGDNTLTLRATDLAGNVTTTNLTITLDLASATNPPAITIAWPLDSTLVAGTNFTLRGSLDDDTASVAVSGLGTDSIAGSVERGGTFRVENLPLPNPTNVLTITATNAAGYSSAVQLTVCQSSVALAINPVPAAQLQQPTFTVTGTIGDTSQSVWVNGTPATVDPVSSAWTVDLPAPLAGTINLDVQAGPDPSTAVAAQSLLLEMPPVVRVAAYKAVYTNQYQVLCDNTPALELTTQNTAWEEGVGGSSLGNYTTLSYGGCASAVPWPAYWPDGQTLQGQDCHGTIYQTPVLPWQYSALLLGDAWFGNVVDCGPGTIRGTAALSVQTALELATGGLAQTGAQKLIQLTVSAAGYSGPLLSVAPGGPSGTLGTAMTSPGNIPLPLSSIQICGQTPTPTATNAYVGQVLVSVPAGGTSAVPYSVTGSQFYSIAAQAQDASPSITANAVPLAPATVVSNANFCVGQNVSFALSALPAGVTATNFHWTLGGTFVNESNRPSASSSINYTNDTTLLTNAVITNCWWVSGGTNPPDTYSASVTCTLLFTNGNPSQQYTNKGLFTMHRPQVLMLNPTLYGAPTNVWISSTLFWQASGNGTIGLGEMNETTGSTNIMGYVVGIVSSNFAGHAKITQICTINATGRGLNYCTNWLDNGDPYNTNMTVTKVNMNFIPTSPLGGLNTMELDDAPQAASSLYQAIQMNDSFVDYVMFIPDYSGSGSIYVPLGKITWSTSAGVSWPSTTISPNSVIGPTGPDSSQAWPAWTNVYSNP